MAVTGKLKIELPCEPAIPLPKHIFKGIKSRVFKKYLYTHVHRSIIQNSQRMEITQVSNGETEYAIYIQQNIIQP